jgi:hypothetical protein
MTYNFHKGGKLLRGKIVHLRKCRFFPGKIVVLSLKNFVLLKLDRYRQNVPRQAGNEIIQYEYKDFKYQKKSFQLFHFSRTY